MICPQCGLTLDLMAPDTCPRCGYPLRPSPQSAGAEEQPPAQQLGSGAGPSLNAPNAPFGAFGQTSAPPSAPQAGQPFVVSGGPYAQGVPPALPPYGTPSGPSGPHMQHGQYGRYAPTSMPPASSAQPLYGAPAPFGQQAAASDSLYGQPAPASRPLYGQQAASGGPLYGQANAPGAASYGQPSGNSGPLYAPAPGYGRSPTGGMPLYGQRGPVSGAETLRMRVVAAASAPTRSRRWLIVGLVVALVVVLAGAGAAIAALSSRNGSVLFSDALTSDNGHWPTDANCSFQPDGYHIADGRICYANAGNFSDANISVQLRQVSGPTAAVFSGIAFRRVSQGNLYTFGISAGGQWAFTKTVNGQQVALAGTPLPSSAIHQGLASANTLEIRAAGSHFEFFVNGTQVGSADDATFTSGICGLFADQGIETSFTSFQVSK